MRRDRAGLLALGSLVLLGAALGAAVGRHRAERADTAQVPGEAVKARAATPARQPPPPHFRPVYVAPDGHEVWAVPPATNETFPVYRTDGPYRVDIRDPGETRAPRRR